MKPPAPTTPESAPPPGRHAPAAGFHALVQLGLVTFIFVLVNLLSCQKFTQQDATRSRAFTLSPTTHQVLGTLEKRARIIVAFVEPTPLRDKVWRLARAYADARPGQVRTQLLDPLRDPDAARDLGQRYQHEFKENAVLVVMGPRIEVIPAEALEIQRRKADGTLESIGFAGEEALTAAFLRLVDPKPAVVYLIAGKGPWPATTHGNGSVTLRRILLRQHADLRELSLDGLAAIPDDASAVIIANPRYDFSGSEVRLLRDFWDRRKGGIVVLLNSDPADPADPVTPTPNLDAFVRYHGIVPDPHRRTVLRATSGPLGTVKELAVPVRFLAGPALTDKFLNTDTRFPGTSTCLEVLDRRDDVRNRGLRPLALAQTAEGFWAEASPGDPSPAFDPGEDKAGPLVVAAAVERAAVEDALVKVPAARMVVLGNAHLLNPDALIQPNVDFFFSALNWAMDREQLVGVGPKQTVFYQSTLTERQSRLLHVSLLAVLPGLALAAAWVVHLRRRS